MTCAGDETGPADGARWPDWLTELCDFVRDECRRRSNDGRLREFVADAVTGALYDLCASGRLPSDLARAKSLVRTMVRNATTDALRGKRARHEALPPQCKARTLSPFELLLVKDEMQVGKSIDDSDLFAWGRAKIDEIRVPPLQRAILILTAEALSHRDAAARLGRRLRDYRVARQRLLARLRAASARAHRGR